MAIEEGTGKGYPSNLGSPNNIRCEAARHNAGPARSNMFHIDGLEGPACYQASIQRLRR